MRALVIEDEPSARVVLARMLGEMDIEVVEVETAEEAFLRLEDKGPFDFALVDWMLPEKSGIDVVREIRANSNHDDLVLLMVTAKHEIADIETALTAGAAEYLMKPVERDAIRDKLRLVGLLD